MCFSVNVLCNVLNHFVNCVITMELYNKYYINVISYMKNPGTFIVALKRNDEDLSSSYKSYIKHLNSFKSTKMSDWFESLDYPANELGEVVLVRMYEKSNEWARGIISKYGHLSPEIYLIDTQTFLDRNKSYELRICPPKLLQLKLPTYTIHTDIDLNTNNDNLKNAIYMMIDQNQHGKLNIIFTPQSVQNNDYSGVVTVNSIPLKKYLKVLLKKYNYKENCQLPISFNPLQFKHLKNIFIPRHSFNDSAFLDESLVSNCLEFRDLNNSLENLSSCVSYDEPSKSTTDYYEDFSDDSRLKIKNSKNSQTTNVKQKIYSSFSSSLSVSDSSSSFDLEHNSPKCLPVNRSLTDESNSENTEKCRKSIILESVEDKSQVVNKTSIIENQDFDINKPSFNALMKKRTRMLKQKERESQQNKTLTETLKLKDKECVQNIIIPTETLKLKEKEYEQNKNITDTSKKTPSISLSNDDLWWSDEDINNLTF